MPERGDRTQYRVRTQAKPVDPADTVLDLPAHAAGAGAQRPGHGLEQLLALVRSGESDSAVAAPASSTNVPAMDLRPGTSIVAFTYGRFCLNVSGSDVAPDGGLNRAGSVMRSRRAA
jgi:hypothetical protein